MIAVSTRHRLFAPPSSFSSPKAKPTCTVSLASVSLSGALSPVLVLHDQNANSVPFPSTSSTPPSSSQSIHALLRPSSSRNRARISTSASLSPQTRRRKVSAGPSAPCPTPTLAPVVSAPAQPVTRNPRKRPRQSSPSPSFSFRSKGKKPTLSELKFHAGVYRCLLFTLAKCRHVYSEEDVVQWYDGLGEEEGAVLTHDAERRLPRDSVLDAQDLLLTNRLRSHLLLHGIPSTLLHVNASEMHADHRWQPKIYYGTESSKVFVDGQPAATGSGVPNVGPVPDIDATHKAPIFEQVTESSTINSPPDPFQMDVDVDFECVTSFTPRSLPSQEPSSSSLYSSTRSMESSPPSTISLSHAHSSIPPPTLPIYTPVQTVAQLWLRHNGGYPRYEKRSSASANLTIRRPSPLRLQIQTDTE